MLWNDDSAPQDVRADLTKWYNGYLSAYSPTLDADDPEVFSFENEWLIERGMFMDYEIVSTLYDEHPHRMDFLKDSLIPHGFGYFGHGHAHDDHDAFDYDGAYNSFRTNYERMVSYGLKPVSYAYPYGNGRKASTQRALRDAGFLSGRMFQPRVQGYGPYIMPGKEKAPPNWYTLPSLRMEDAAFEGCTDVCTNNPEQFAQHLHRNVELGSWLISTYHSIGFDGETPGRDWIAWGFYRQQNFLSDMTLVQELRDEGKVWLAGMDAVTLYILQRNATRVRMDATGEDSFSLSVTNNLDKEFYDHDLTVRLRILPKHVGRRLIVSHSESADPALPIIDTVMSSQVVLVNLRAQTEPYAVYLQ